jgi:predicted Zn-dependent protease with MMP-like domain
MERDSFRQDGHYFDTGGDGREAIEPDYYAVLGVAAGAREEEVKREFRRLAKLWHPDHFTMAPPDLRARAERRMQALNRAYDILSDPVRKVAYDQRRRHAEMGSDHHHYYNFAEDYEPATYGYSGGSAYNQRMVPGEFNPNGAGMVGGVLCLILALGTLWRISTDGLLAGLGPVLGLAGFIGLIILAGYLFDSKSRLAWALRRFLERDPRLQGKQALRSQQADSRQSSHQASFGSAFAAADEPTAFERLVDEALADVPAEFHSYLDNLVVRVKDEPSPDELKRMKVRPCNLLLGLYEGVPLIQQGARAHPPEVITIFQHSIESYCHEDPDRIRRQVRATVFHELAHHFGMSHEEMPAWVK